MYIIFIKYIFKKSKENVLPEEFPSEIEPVADLGKFQSLLIKQEEHW